MLSAAAESSPRDHLRLSEQFVLVIGKIHRLNTKMKKVRQYARQMPLLLLGLLALGWVASLFASFGWVFPAGGGKQIAIRCEDGSVQLSKSVRYELSSGPYWEANSHRPNLVSSFGKLDMGRMVTAGWLAIPIPMLLLLLLPLWLGPRMKFRFQRSHLLAYSGSLAGMLAFYLGWGS